MTIRYWPPMASFSVEDFTYEGTRVHKMSRMQGLENNHGCIIICGKSAISNGSPYACTRSEFERSKIEQILELLQERDIHSKAAASLLWQDNGWRWKLLGQSSQCCSHCRESGPWCIYADSGGNAYIIDNYFHLCEKCGYIQHIRINSHAVLGPSFWELESYAPPASCPLCEVVEF